MKTTQSASNAAPTEAATPTAASPRISVSAVVPVFNSAETLDELVRRTHAALAACASHHELILVNDGSSDASWEAIEAIASSDAAVRGVDLARNYGQHNALLAGIREARCEVTVTLDDDLQNPPEEIPILLEALSADCDVVYGEPVVKRQGLGRRVATQVVVRALGVLGGRTAPMVSSFRAFRTDLREGFAAYSGPDVSIDGLLTWQTERFRSAPVAHVERAHGESNYSLIKLTRHALTMITAFSTRPLRIATTFGFIVVLFGAAILADVLLRFLIEGTSVPGFPFLASIISIFAGAQLFAIGVIGEYLARVHVRVMSKPSYVIRARVNRQSQGASAASTLSPASTEEPCRLLAWDSEFWGFPIAQAAARKLDRTQAETVAAWCDRNGVRCAYLLADAGDARTAEAATAVGFRAVDTRLTLETEPESEPPAVDGRPGASVRAATVSDADALTAIARAAHTDTRFFFDTRFGTDRARELYAAWVRRGLSEDSRRLLVTERAGKLAGYVLLASDPPSIDLIAVEPTSRRQGIGGTLMAAALGEQPATRLRVVTQARNTTALRLYEAFGFRSVAAETWYHRWR
ncbi:MAG TPA: GNAT family N-acetyltransferase [Solirubrobacterales bacterium]|nr:GNAT family N-acetyltransferase [Solirubrobacterales bacterium]